MAGGPEGPLTEEKGTLMSIIFALIKTLHNTNIRLPALNPTAEELSFPIFGVWREPGLLGGQGQIQSAHGGDVSKPVVFAIAVCASSS